MVDDGGDVHFSERIVWHEGKGFECGKKFERERYGKGGDSWVPRYICMGILLWYE